MAKEACQFMMFKSSHLRTTWSGIKIHFTSEMHVQESDDIK